MFKSINENVINVFKKIKLSDRCSPVVQSPSFFITQLMHSLRSILISESFFFSKNKSDTDISSNENVLNERMNV